MAIVLDGKNLTIEDMVRVARNREPVQLSVAAKERINRCRRFIEEKVKARAVMYGITTGIGELSETILSPEQTEQFQRYIVYSHSAGCGVPLPEEVVRAGICSRINVLSIGHSGIRLAVVECMVDMLNKGVTPVVYDKGSVGACGDLSPMSQMALVLLGEGEAFYQGRRMRGAEAMKAAGIRPIQFEARDGLASINGSNMTAGWGALLLADAGHYFKVSEIAAAMTLEVVNANMAAYDERIHKVRGFSGAVTCAENIRRLTDGSVMLQQPGKKVQDAYSLRSTPQVVGSAKDALRWARTMFETELNGVGDNPIFFPEEKAYLTGANFQGTPLGLSLDLVGTCVTMIAVLSERRTNRLLNRNLSCGLPAFLTKGAGMFSGLMLTQYTQGMLICEDRILSAPASIGSIPAAADQEDFVSMAFTSALKAAQILNNAWYVVAIELMAGAQAIEFRKPLAAGKGTAVAYEFVRRYVEKMAEDRPVQDDINNLTAAVRSGDLLKAVEGAASALN
ncbi:aromatic amino acid lyase [candidate division WOR-3 bacterium]|nr:aromatic amino acid lyase [candidate division WOR-3 bacterium]